MEEGVEEVGVKEELKEEVCNLSSKRDGQRKRKQ